MKKNKDNKLIIEALIEARSNDGGSYQQRAAAAGQKFAASGGKMFVDPDEDDPVRDGPGYDPDGNPIDDYNPDEGSGYTDQGLQELEPHELVEFIGEALPKFLQTHYDPESYDEVHKALYNAAYTINWNSHDG